VEGGLLKMEDINTIIEKNINKAVELAKENPNGFTIGLIQRRLHIGYIAAAKLQDEMERRGYIGPYIPGKLREVYIQ
jgi:DNA segregation ATPase FtsK/SpoIIIE-like protein